MKKMELVVIQAAREKCSLQDASSFEVRITLETRDSRDQSVKQESKIGRDRERERKKLVFATDLTLHSFSLFSAPVLVMSNDLRDRN